MHSPSARVTIVGGKATVEVYLKNVVVEVRNYDVQQNSGNGRELWRDRDGKYCDRYFAPLDGRRTLASDCATTLEEFADALGSLPKMSVTFEREESPDGLHVLSINGVDYYFNADGSGYDGWGRAIPQDPDRGSR